MRALGIGWAGAVGVNDLNNEDGGENERNGRGQSGRATGSPSVRGPGACLAHARAQCDRQQGTCVRCPIPALLTFTPFFPVRQSLPLLVVIINRSDYYKNAVAGRDHGGSISICV
jgi:hypothetical protein